MSSDSPFIEHILKIAAEDALSFGATVVSTPHLFVALTSLDGITVQALIAQGVNPQDVQEALRHAVGVDKAGESKKLHLTTRAVAKLDRATQLATEEKSEISEKHLLFAILQDGKESLTLRVLTQVGVDLDMLRQAARPVSATPILDQLGRDLTDLARQDKLSPMIGRKEELRRLVRTLLS